MSPRAAGADTNTSFLETPLALVDAKRTRPCTRMNKENAASSLDDTHSHREKEPLGAAFSQLDLMLLEGAFEAMKIWQVSPSAWGRHTASAEHAESGAAAVKRPCTIMC